MRSQQQPRQHVFLHRYLIPPLSTRPVPRYQKRSWGEGRLQAFPPPARKKVPSSSPSRLRVLPRPARLKAPSSHRRYLRQPNLGRQILRSSNLSAWPLRPHWARLEIRAHLTQCLLEVLLPSLALQQPQQPLPWALLPLQARSQASTVAEVAAVVAAVALGVVAARSKHMERAVIWAAGVASAAQVVRGKARSRGREEKAACPTKILRPSCGLVRYRPPLVV
jgi:hypothetical protein